MEEDDDSFEQNDKEEGRPLASHSPEDGCRNHEDGEKESEPTDERVCELKRRLCPLHEIVCVDGCLQVFCCRWPCLPRRSSRLRRSGMAWCR